MTKEETSIEDARIVRTIIRAGQQPTEAQIREIEYAVAMPIVLNIEAPELTPEQCLEMASIARTHLKTSR